MSTVLILATLTLLLPPAFAGGEWEATKRGKASGSESGPRVVEVDVARPGVVAVEMSSPYVYRAGDNDGFGFGAGWQAPQQCDVFDNRGPGDFGVMDQRRPGSEYGSICDFTGSWVNTMISPPGGAGQVQVAIRVLGGQGSVAFCFANPCGCATPLEELYLNGEPEDSFLPYVNCGDFYHWTKTYQGAEAAAFAAGGAVAFNVLWKDNPFAIDYSEIRVLPAVEVAVESGDGQKGVISNLVENKLKVKFTTADPAFSLTGMSAVFEIVSVPSNASGHGIGAAEASAVQQVYATQVDADGFAEAVLMLGNKQGAYVVQVKSPLSITGVPATFTINALKPASVGVLKDNTNLDELTATYAVSAVGTTPFFALGLDAEGKKIGPIKCTWSTSAGGNPSTRGDGIVNPVGPGTSTTFTPTKVGKLKLAANPTISGVGTAQAELFITKLYVDVDGFDINNPVDQHASFLPGSHVDGTSILPLAMPQEVKLHLLTGGSSRGEVTFTLSDVTTYPGIAMNHPIGSAALTDADMYFISGGIRSDTTTLDFSGSGDTTATLYVNDYAAYGKLNVTINSGQSTYALAPITLPGDANGNKIADRGWIAETATINDTSLGVGNDEDNNPATTAIQPPYPPGATAGAIGDNLTNFEEYRGFRVRDAHRRTNPFHKDFFVEIEDFGNDILHAHPALPTATHLVYLSNADGSRTMNPNSTGLPGATNAWPNGHRDQSLHQVLKGMYSPFGDALGDTPLGLPWGELTPAVPNTAFPSTVYQGAINDSAAFFGVTDPNLILELRRTTVLHECGHSVNLWEITRNDCVMFGGSFRQDQGFELMPNTLCTGIPETYLIRTLFGPLVPIPPEFLINCSGCPTEGIQMLNFNERDTLRVKEPQ